MKKSVKLTCRMAGKTCICFDVAPIPLEPIWMKLKRIKDANTFIFSISCSQFFGIKVFFAIFYAIFYLICQQKWNKMVYQTNNSGSEEKIV